MNPDPLHSIPNEPILPPSEPTNLKASSRKGNLRPHSIQAWKHIKEDDSYLRIGYFTEPHGPLRYESRVVADFFWGTKLHKDCRQALPVDLVHFGQYPVMQSLHTLSRCVSHCWLLLTGYLTPLLCILVAKVVEQLPLSMLDYKLVESLIQEKNWTRTCHAPRWHSLARSLLINDK